jgi:hypothetical protein
VLVFNDKKVYFTVKNISAVSALLILLGNCLNFGDYLIELLFKPIEKELFSCKKKEHYTTIDELKTKANRYQNIDNTKELVNNNNSQTLN